MQLVGRDSVRAGAHQVHRSQPVPHSDVAGLEDSADLDAKGLATRIALIKTDSRAFSLERPGMAHSSAVRAHASVCPNSRLYIGVSSGFIIELRSRKNRC